MVAGTHSLQTVLVVASDPGLRVSIRAALESGGFGVDEARSGLSGMAAALGQHPDLVLVEAGLVDIDGFAVVTRLRGRGFSAPLVVIGKAGDDRHALAAGADGLLALPLDPDTLAARARAWLAGNHGDLPAEQAGSELRAHAQELAAHLEGKARELDQAQHRIEDTNRFRSEFMQAVSHELATPLTPITGYLKILKSEKLGALNDRQSKVIDAMIQSTERLARVLDNLVDFANLETGRTLLREEPVDPRAIAEACIAEMRAAARNRRVGLAIWDESGGRNLVGDATKLKQALGNLVDNAVKFSPSGGQVLVELAAEPEGLVISVYDQGAGVPLAESQRIFEPFFHASRAGEAERAPGAGLGLPVVRAIAKAHGGRAWAESPPRRQPERTGHFYPGSRFSIFLPWTPPENGLVPRRTAS
ncbi:ATP-binding protein [Vulgatibacter sp.]|uniref:hybrid sensor histidine kinase/response regulator n=1 Tax=Vulgatibacter sp. TaxID=1971226 RepID=UPI003568566C